MKKYKLLVLTDHTNHSKENSLYPLVRAMRASVHCAQLDVATRGNKQNDSFFKLLMTNKLWVNTVDENFCFSAGGMCFTKNLRQARAIEYDAIWLRMPPPLSEDFLKFLTKVFSTQVIVNNPLGIYKTGSKEFLLNFPELCPPMQVCHSIADIEQFKQQFPIVLKPFREYGGKGIIRIDGEEVWEGKMKTTFAEFAHRLAGKRLEYLGVKFLKNVGQGDKRIIVVNGKVMGASLRLPAAGSWICNVAMGGTSDIADIAPEEIDIVQAISPKLTQMGIVMYGIDTLVNDDGKRVLSELNTTSIGGLPQTAKMLGEPLVEEAIELIWTYIIKQSCS